MRRFQQACALVLTLFLASPIWATELVMVEQDGCVYCARWNAKIGTIYHKTDEGKFAPLRRTDLNDPTPDDLSFDKKVVFTPTFILVDEGQEIGRIEGYPGEELFWWMLAKLLADNTNFQGGGPS